MESSPTKKSDDNASTPTRFQRASIHTKKKYHAIRETFMQDHFRRLDLFAKPVTLTFKGHSKYKTNCGACLSLFYILLILLFLCQQFLKVKNGSISSVNYMVKDGI